VPPLFGNEILNHRVFDIFTPGQTDFALRRSQEGQAETQGDEQAEGQNHCQYQIRPGDSFQQSPNLYMESPSPRKYTDLGSFRAGNRTTAGRNPPFGTVYLLGLPPAGSLYRSGSPDPGVGELQDFSSPLALIRRSSALYSLLLDDCNQTGDIPSIVVSSIVRSLPTVAMSSVPRLLGGCTMSSIVISTLNAGHIMMKGPKRAGILHLGGQSIPVT
jgi:hypothetical protein